MSDRKDLPDVEGSGYSTGTDGPENADAAPGTSNTAEQAETEYGVGGSAPDEGLPPVEET